MTHPHPDPRHVMQVYRRYLLACKAKFGTARSLVHYRKLVKTYLEAKRLTARASPMGKRDPA